MGVGGDWRGLGHLGIINEIQRDSHYSTSYQEAQQGLGHDPRV